MMPMIIVTVATCSKFRTGSQPGFLLANKNLKHPPRLLTCGRSPLWVQAV
jgi:hypothetical protein